MNTGLTYAVPSVPSEVSPLERLSDENQYLRTENARLTGQIQGMWEIMKFFKLNHSDVVGIPTRP